MGIRLLKGNPVNQGEVVVRRSRLADEQGPVKVFIRSFESLHKLAGIAVGLSGVERSIFLANDVGFVGIAEPRNSL